MTWNALSPIEFISNYLNWFTDARLHLGEFHVHERAIDYN